MIGPPNPHLSPIYENPPCEIWRSELPDCGAIWVERSKMMSRKIQASIPSFMSQTVSSSQEVISQHRSFIPNLLLVDWITTRNKTWFCRSVQKNSGLEMIFSGLAITFPLLSGASFFFPMASWIWSKHLSWFWILEKLLVGGHGKVIFHEKVQPRVEM